jgi:hypothetical protein
MVDVPRFLSTRQIIMSTINILINSTLIGVYKISQYTVFAEAIGSKIHVAINRWITLQVSFNFCVFLQKVLGTTRHTFVQDSLIVICLEDD